MVSETVLLLTVRYCTLPSCNVVEDLFCSFSLFFVKMLLLVVCNDINIYSKLKKGQYE